jgi:uncharacterized protein (TIGR03086 family)
MTEIADRYRRLSDRFADQLAQVPPDRWDSPTPCEDWTVRDLVAHMVQTQGMFLGFVGRDIGELPSVDDDPVGAWNAARAVVQANLDDPSLATTEFDGLSGRTTFETGVDRFLSGDLVIHGWDLARGAGLDETIDPDDVARCLEEFPKFGDAMRGPGAFGPAVEPAPDADAQTRLLNFVGREV